MLPKILPVLGPQANQSPQYHSHHHQSPHLQLLKENECVVQRAKSLATTLGPVQRKCRLRDANTEHCLLYLYLYTGHRLFYNLIFNKIINALSPK